MKNIIKKNYLLFIGTFFIIYFIFNLLDGERGFISYLKKNNQFKELIKKETNLKKQISELETKNYLISDKIDLDLIETIIRDKFVYGKEGEKVYIVIQNDK